MAIKIFNFTNDKYIEGSDTRAEIGHMVDNTGHGCAFLGDVKKSGNNVTVKSGSIIIVGGLCVHVLSDEVFSASDGNYVVAETTYSDAPSPDGDGTIEHYTCQLKSTNTVSVDILPGNVPRHYQIYDVTQELAATGAKVDYASNAYEATYADHAKDALSAANITIGDATHYNEWDVHYSVTPGDDISPVIASAIAALPPEGGVIEFTEGTFYIKTRVSITKPNVTIRGRGEATLFIKQVDIAFIYRSTVGQHTFSDFKIDGLSRSDSSYGAGVGISGSGGNVIIKNVTFTKIYGYAIQANIGEYNAVIDSCKIYSTGHGMHVYGGTSNNVSTAIITNNYLYDIGIEASQWGDGIMLNNILDFAISNNVIKLVTRLGMSIDTSVGAVTGNVAAGAITAIMTRGTITGNRITNTSGNSITVTGNQNCVAGNVCSYAITASGTGNNTAQNVINAR